MVPTLLRRGLQALPVYLFGVLLVLSTASLVGDPAPVYAADNVDAQPVVLAVAPVHLSVVLGPLPLPVLVPAPID